MERGATRGYAAAIGSAAFVGLFTVLNKWLLTEAVPPLAAGAWTYAAAGLALLPLALRSGRPHLQRPWLLLAWLLAGSVFGPCFYFLGLKLTSGVQGVLLINLEAIFTALLAFVIFGERLTRSTLTAGLAVVGGGIWISWPRSGDLLAGPTLGNLLIGLGYLGWATENNLGRVLAARSPAATLVCLKALAAALVLATLATLFHQPLAVPWHVIPGILASGALSLGLSLILFYYAMGHIGAGRAGLISATSSLWGVLAAMLLLLHESLNLQTLAGGLLMLAGLLVFVWESTRGSDLKRPVTS